MQKFYITFRTLFLSFLISCLFLNVVAQSKSNKVISITVKDGKLAQILKKIQDQAQMQIVYNGQLVDQESLQTVVAKNEGLIQLLDRILRNTQLTYTVQNDVIVLSQKQQDSKVVSGTVINTDGEFLLVATITNITTGVTTRSNEKGFFRISAEIGHRLQVSHVGFEIYEQEIRNFKSLTITLYSKEQVLEDVVLTGYQTIDKRLSAGSTFSLKGKDIEEPNVSNIASMLQGKVPGLSIETNSGSPNAIPRMRVRGTSTLVGNANPIWVVDGIIREDPVNVNPDNVMGLNPSDMEKILRGGVQNASADLMGNSISGVNVNDIETITFLKDAAATSLYGTRAANGVIVITTKRGQVGEPKLDYSASLGFVQKPNYNQLQLMNSQERTQLSQQLYADGFRFKVQPLPLGYDGAYIDLINRTISQEEFDQRVADLETQNTDWFDLLFKNSFNQTHSLSLSGGSENTSYRSSLSYSNLRGTAPKDRNDNINGSIAMNSRMNKKLRVDFSLNGGYRNSTGYYNTVNPLSYAIRTNRAIHPNLFYPAKLTSFGQTEGTSPLEYNIFNEIAETGNSTKNTQLNTTLSVNYKILPSLTFISLLGAGASSQTSEQYATERSFAVAQFRGYDYGSVIAGGPEESMSPLPFGGELNTNDHTNLTYSWRNSLNFNQSLFSGRDLLTLFGAQEIRSSKYKGSSIYQHGYLKDRGESFAILPAYYYVFQRQMQNLVENSFSVLGSATYSISQKYVLNGNIRVDASNRFGQFTNSRFLPVWSVAGRWNVDQEQWLRDSYWISALMLKGSYGVQGNAVKNVGPDLILDIPTYDAIHPLAKEYILRIKSLAYPDLKWEQTKSYNVEMGLGLFDNFVTMALGAYYKKTEDAISRFDVPAEYGNYSMYMNGATIVNKGIEVAIDFNLIQKNDWTWRISANTSKNWNQLSKGSDVIMTIYDYLNGNLQQTDQPLGTFYVFGYKGLNPANGIPMFDGIDDIDNPRDLEYEKFLIKAGSKHYDITGGLSSIVNYKNWGIHAHFNFSLGAMRLLNPLFKGDNAQLGPDPDQNLPKSFTNRWRQPGDETYTNIPSFTPTLSEQREYAGSHQLSRYHMYDQSTIMLAPADFLKLRNLAVSYQVPSKWAQHMRISQASIFMGVSNVFTIANKLWDGQDPETFGVGTSALPQVPAYNLSINISF